MQVCEASSAVALPLRVVLTTTVALPRLKRPEGSRLIDRPDRRGNCRLTSGWDVPSSWCRRSKTRQRASPARLGTVRPRRMRQPKSGRVGVLPAGARLPRWSRTNVIGRPLGLRVPARTQSPRHRGACCWPLHLRHGPTGPRLGRLVIREPCLPHTPGPPRDRLSVVKAGLLDAHAGPVASSCRKQDSALAAGPPP